MHEITLTIAQHEAIARVFGTLSIRDREATRRVNIRRNDGLVEVDDAQIIRVVFDAGWGTSTFDIDADGNSEHIAFPNGTSIGETMYDLDPGDDPVALADAVAALRERLVDTDGRKQPFSDDDVTIAAQFPDLLDTRLSKLYADWRADRITDAFYTAELLKLGYTKSVHSVGGRPVAIAMNSTSTI